MSKEKRACRKCGELIPWGERINGKFRSFQNRKFCLKCSRYKGRNTSPNDPVVRVPRKWQFFSEEQKIKNKVSTYERGLRIRDELYARSGGKCQMCGYSKCKRALSFHHRDPSTKIFGLAINYLWSKKRELIDQEWAKCDLLCLNCHNEIEDQKARKNGIVAMVNKQYGTNY